MIKLLLKILAVFLNALAIVIKSDAKPIPLCWAYGKYGLEAPAFVGHVTAPSVTTVSVTGITKTQVTGNGNITSTGGANPTVRGFCYLIGSGTPTIADSVVNESGSFNVAGYTLNITGLTQGTLYSVRAYATNSAGTGYGGTISVTTVANLPPTVALNSPADLATGLSTTPTLEFTGTDADADDVRYNVQVKTVPFEPIIDISDNFLEGSLDTTKWNNWGGARVVQTGGQLEISSTTTSGYYGIDSQIRHNLTDKAVFVEVKDVGNQSLNSWEVYPIQLVHDANNKYEIVIFQGNIGLRKIVAGTLTFITADVTYNSAVHKWFRIRHTGSTLYLEYATDGISWTAIASESPSITITNLVVSVLVGAWQNEGVATKAIFDNFNIEPVLIDAVSNINAGFANTVTPADTDPFNSGEKADYDVQAGDALTAGTYYWRVRAIDPTGSNTYGAWSATRSFEVADAAITETHTVDSLVKEELVNTHTADSLVKAVVENTHTVDSYVTTQLNETHTVDSLVNATVTETHTADSLVKAEVEATHTVDSFVAIPVAEVTETHTTDSLVKDVVEATHTVDTLVLAEVVNTHTTDSLVKAVLTETHTVDSLVKAETTNTHTADSLVKAELTNSHTVDSFVALSVAEVTTTHTTDSLVLAQVTNTYTTDSVVRAELTNTHTADSFVRAELTNTHTTDSFVLAELTASHTVDSFVAEDETGQCFLLLEDGDTVLAEDGTKIRLEGCVVDFEEVTHTSDSLVKAELVNTHTSDSLVKAELVNTHTSDSLVKAEAVNTYTVDSLVKAELVNTHTSDSLVKAELVNTHTSDSLVKAEAVNTYTVDSLVNVENTATHTADSLVKAELTNTHTADSLVLAPQTASHTTDSFVYEAGEVFVSHTIDALVLGDQTLTHTIDSFVAEPSGRLMYRDGGVWRAVPIKYRVGGVWQPVTLKYRQGGTWINIT